jgi:hypothetical protein
LYADGVPALTRVPAVEMRRARVIRKFAMTALLKSRLGIGLRVFN